MATPINGPFSRNDWWFLTCLPFFFSLYLDWPFVGDSIARRVIYLDFSTSLNHFEIERKSGTVRTSWWKSAELASGVLKSLTIKSPRRRRLTPRLLDGGKQVEMKSVSVWLVRNGSLKLSKLKKRSIMSPSSSSSFSHSLFIGVVDNSITDRDTEDRSFSSLFDLWQLETIALSAIFRRT